MSAFWYHSKLSLELEICITDGGVCIERSERHLQNLTRIFKGNFLVAFLLSFFLHLFFSRLEKHSIELRTISNHSTWLAKALDWSFAAMEVSGISSTRSWVCIRDYWFFRFLCYVFPSITYPIFSFLRPYSSQLGSKSSSSVVSEFWLFLYPQHWPRFFTHSSFHPLCHSNPSPFEQTENECSLSSLWKNSNSNWRRLVFKYRFALSRHC